MATRRTSKGALAAAAKSQSVTVKASVLVSEATPAYYVNNMEVSHTAHDFTLICSKLPTKLSAAELERVSKSGELPIEASVQITCATTLIPALMRALNTQKEMYEKQFGPIPDSAAAEVKLEH